MHSPFSYGKIGIKKGGGRHADFHKGALCPAADDGHRRARTGRIGLAGLLHSSRGAQGGYRLTRSPEDYPLGDILRLTEGDLAPVACLEGGENCCARCDTCATLDFWTGLYAAVQQYVDQYTLADLVRTQREKEK